MEEHTVQDFLQRFDSCLSARGLRSTSQRRTVVDVFFRTEGHHSVEQLWEAVRDKEPSIGYATVYRTIKLLKSCGLASERRFGDGFARYEVAHEDEHHDHLMCLDCGRIVEFENPRIEALQEQVAKEYGMKLQQHRLDLWGRCQTLACPHRERAERDRTASSRPSPEGSRS